jgi:predicted DsbA family dithiol-disulfide isomerase
MRVDIWSGTVCLWCHIGCSRFSRALTVRADEDQARGVGITGVPFRVVIASTAARAHSLPRRSRRRCRRPGGSR